MISSTVPAISPPHKMHSGDDDGHGAYADNLPRVPADGAVKSSDRVSVRSQVRMRMCMGGCGSTVVGKSWEIRASTEARVTFVQSRRGVTTSSYVSEIGMNEQSELRRSHANGTPGKKTR